MVTLFPSDRRVISTSGLSLLGFFKLTLTESPSLTNSLMMASAMVSSRYLCTARRIGRAPYVLATANASRVTISGILSDTSMVMLWSSSARATVSAIRLEAISFKFSYDKGENTTISSIRLSNSGRSASSSAPLTTSVVIWASSTESSASRAAWMISLLPMFDVMTKMLFLKLTVLPFPSVNWPSSMICKSKFRTSSCAFSNSSKRTTECGDLRTASVSWPPSSYPT